MGLNATIGALKVVLGLDSAEFIDGLNAAQAHLRKVGRNLERTGKQIEAVGASLSLGLTAPILAMGAAAIKASGNFEAAMNRVGISTKATAKEMADLEVAARAIGKASVFSASEAADAMDMLAKTGLSVTTILGGAAKATVDLAAAAGSELEPAASAISDTIQQFKLNTAELPGVVNQITGAVNESKLSFDDYSLAIGQAGGVAANLGVNFQDFNAVIAGTSSLFSSGSDAGTSFKTFLSALVPSTKQAAEAMAQYGLRFFDAKGEMLGMSAVADMLKTKLGGLSDEAKSEVLKKIFGADGMRTAIGLMEQGAAGLDAIKAKILETDAAAQAAKRMEGFNGQLEQLKGSLEELGIAIGKSGLLGFMTDLAKSAAALVDAISAANPQLLKIGVVIAAVVAAIGPLVFIIGSAVSAFGVLLGVLSAPITLPIIGAIAAVAAVFAVFGDAIIPALKAFGAELQRVLGPKIQPLFQAFAALAGLVAGAFKTAFGADSPTGANLRAFGILLARVFGAAVDLVTGAVNVITALLRGLGALLRLDFGEAWKQLGLATVAAVRGISEAVKTLVPEVLGYLAGLYTGAKTWLINKLGGVMTAVADKARAVGDAFFQLYDRVVGHSYVPDMVEGIAEWMGKLDAGMVQPAVKSAKKTGEAFKDLRDDVGTILDSLLSPGETKTLQIARDMVVLRKALDAGVIGLGTYRDAIDRLNPVTEVFRQQALAADELIRTPADLGVEWATAGEIMQRNAEDVADAFYGISQAVDDIFRGVANNDWVSAFGGLTRALNQVQKAFSATGTAADKFAAAAGVANAVGGAIGGTAGAGISGAASGALAGFQVGGPIGAAIGGIIGGLGGIFGASKAKKRAKKEAAERARQEAERKAAEVAAAKRALELRLMELGGDAAGAAAGRRADELAAMDESLRGLQEQVWAQEKLAAIAEQRRDLELQLLDAQGDAAAEEMRRADILASLDESLRPLQQAIWDVIDANAAREESERALQAEIDAANSKVDAARDTLSEAFEREAEELEDAAGRFSELADNLAALGRRLQADTSASDPRRAAAFNRAEFERVAARAAAGDETAAGQLEGVIDAFLESSLATATDSASYQRDRRAAQAAVAAAEAAARGRANTALSQLAQLEASVAGLLQIDKSVVSVRDAIVELNTALSAAAVAQANAIEFLAATTNGLSASVTAAISAANDNATAVNVGGYDVAAAQAVLAGVMSPLEAQGGSDGLAESIVKQLMAEQEKYLKAIALNTSDTAGALSDVINGELAINTVAA